LIQRHTTNPQNQLKANEAINESIARKMFPNEKFISSTAQFQKINKYTKGLVIPKGVKVAESRMPNSTEQRRTLIKELRQASMLAKRGNSVYLIPEHGPHGKKLLDAFVNGQLYEFRYTEGNVKTFEVSFKRAKEKGKEINVFMSIESDISKYEARRKIVGVLKNHPDYTGKVVISLPSGKTDRVGNKIYNVYFWNNKDLR